ncbi:MCR_0457 family protein [Moraxella marmotae]|uniref:MCR_0457 family protein n=1 Tax=Moraxella marmotae TaxID=3344520 RepID=UPI0035F3306A
MTYQARRTAATVYDKDSSIDGISHDDHACALLRLINRSNPSGTPSNRPTSTLSSTLKQLVTVLLIIALGLPTAACAANPARYQRVSAPQTINTQEIYLTVSQYELALIQVLSEICPPILNTTQKANFGRAYNRQLHLFMPRSANPHQSLQQLNNQRDYRIILHNVRAWTASFPASENRALCYEFASSV